LVLLSPCAPAALLAERHAQRHAMMDQLHGKNRARIKGVGGKGGGAFSIGDAVAFLPADMGKVGSNIDLNRIICRVVDVDAGTGKCRLRCNTGVINGYHGGGEVLRAAVESAAATLNFGADDNHAAAPEITVTAAVNAELRTFRVAAAPPPRRRGRGRT
jgi:hypothetical protein